MSDVTRLLSQIESGDPSAAAALLPLVYDELRKLAAARLSEEKPGQLLDATALVHADQLEARSAACEGRELWPRAPFKGSENRRWDQNRVYKAYKARKRVPMPELLLSAVPVGKISERLPCV
jgi:hypothetical protein